MTKNEFIHEAAIRMAVSRPDADVMAIAARARDLANELFGVEEQEQVIPYSNEPISNLIREIDRMDEEEKAARNEQLSPGTRWRYNKKGHARIAQTACESESIETVAGLLAFGRYQFLKLYHIGPRVIASVDKALMNLYNIKTW
jgi:hypothetical protein